MGDIAVKYKQIKGHILQHLETIEGSQAKTKYRYYAGEKL